MYSFLPGISHIPLDTLSISADVALIGADYVVLKRKCQKRFAETMKKNAKKHILRPK